MKKKLLIFIGIVVLLMMIIELIFELPKRLGGDAADADTQVNTEDNQIENTLVQQSVDDVVIAGKEIFNTSDSLDFEVDLSSQNPFSELYLKGEFADEMLSVGTDKMSDADLNDAYAILQKVYDVASSNASFEPLEGMVDSATLRDRFKPSLNGVQDAFKNHDDITIIDTLKLSQNVYKLNIVLDNVAGDADTDYQSTITQVTATYNVENKRLSFEQLISRKKVSVIYEDDNYYMFAYMIEGFLTYSNVYIGITSKSDDYTMSEELGEIRAIADGQIINFQITNRGYPINPGSITYFAVRVPQYIYDLESLSF